MSDIQMIALAISIAVPLSLLLYSNSRVIEAKEALRAEMALGFERLSNQISRLEASLKLHEVEHHK